jgi:hypothetical protein
MYPILNYVEFRTNHEPYMVHGVVQGGVRLPQSGSSASWVGATSACLREAASAKAGRPDFRI